VFVCTVYADMLIVILAVLMLAANINGFIHLLEYGDGYSGGNGGLVGCSISRHTLCNVYLRFSIQSNGWVLSGHETVDACVSQILNLIFRD
jgi:hypothetical protein